MAPDLLLALLGAAAAIAAAALLLGRRASQPTGDDQSVRKLPFALSALAAAAWLGAAVALAFRQELGLGAGPAGLFWLIAAGCAVTAARAAGRGAPAVGLGLLFATAIALAGLGSDTAAVAGGSGVLLGLRQLLVGLGLGAWPVALAGSSLAAWRGWRADRALAAGDPLGSAGQQAAASDAREAATGALRYALPWQMLALLAGSAWSLASFAGPWHGTPAEIWVLVAWLTALAYLLATGGARPLRVPAAALALLAALGTLATILVAVAASTLFQVGS